MASLGCNQCKQPLTKIDNYGERLTGCLTLQPLVGC
jgi:hypothetical protein